MTVTDTPAGAAASANRGWRVGIDIGGTFTDVVGIDQSDGTVRIAKVPSRPDDPASAIAEAVEALDLAMDQVSVLVHGTTRVTNAIVQDKMHPVALVGTAGFEDSLEIGRLSRADLYRLDVPPKPKPLVPAERRIGLDERLDHSGTPVTPLADAEISKTIEALKKLNIESVAVSLLHSYANGAHEAVLGAKLVEEGWHVSLSHKINPEEREYERTAVTALNAAIAPTAVNYLQELETEVGLGSRLRLFHSAGGMATPDAVRERPLTMAMSGPAAGVAASANLSATIDRDKLLTFDMGGTTTDVCLILDGKAEISDSRLIAGRPLRMPMVAVESIGAGGGSIVRVGAGGITIGPDSAGAVPGPACYGQGGQLPTTTDINAVLGFLNPDRKLGRRIQLDLEAAHRAVSPLAAKLGLDVIEFAVGATKVANATMARALRKVSVERGIDGRRCTLAAFGGAAPMHAAGLAEVYGIREVVVPHASSVFSALGCVEADTSYTHQMTLRMSSEIWDDIVFQRALEMAGQTVIQPMLDDGADASEPLISHIALVRYVGQSSLVEVPIDLPADPATIGPAFREKHNVLYGFGGDDPFEVQSLRTIALLPSNIQAVAPEERPRSTPEPLHFGECWFDGQDPVRTPRFDRHAFAFGASVDGPAIVEDEQSTIVVPPGWHLRADQAGHVYLEDCRS